MLEDTIKRLATEGRNIAAVTTLMPDGTPQTTPLWVDADDDHILLNTEVHRQKFKNVSRNRESWCVTRSRVARPRKLRKISSANSSKPFYA